MQDTGCRIQDDGKRSVNHPPKGRFAPMVEGPPKGSCASITEGGQAKMTESFVGDWLSVTGCGGNTDEHNNLEDDCCYRFSIR